jgi:hypothetical protein
MGYVQWRRAMDALERLERQLMEVPTYQFAKVTTKWWKRLDRDTQRYMLMSGPKMRRGRRG